MSANSSASAAASTDVRWTILVVFNDLEARRRATQVCDNIVARFWPEMEFQMHWCAFNQLLTPETAKLAIKQAVAATIIIVSTSTDAGLPYPVRAWLKSWCEQRHEREGAFVALVDGSPETAQHTAILHELRTAAHHAGLDFLTHEPNWLPKPIPSESGWIDAKATQIGSVLGAILEQTANIRR